MGKVGMEIFTKRVGKIKNFSKENKKILLFFSKEFFKKILLGNIPF